MAALNRNLVRPFGDRNLGVQADYPKRLIEIEEAGDTDMILQNVDRLVTKGVRFRASEIRSKLGFSDSDGDEMPPPDPRESLASNTTEPV